MVKNTQISMHYTMLIRPRVEEDPKMLIWDFCILTA